MTNRTINIVLISAIIFLLGVGFWIGRSSKSYKERTISKIDTLIIKDTIPKIVYEKQPVNTVIKKEFIKGNTKLVYIDTSTNEQIAVDSTEPLYATLDTLRYKDIYVSILDTGNCYGIINRKYFFGGEIESRVITNTITKTYIPKQKLFSIYGGGFYNLKDFGPSGSLIFKNKVNVGYSYGLLNKSNNFTLQYKLK